MHWDVSTDVEAALRNAAGQVLEPAACAGSVLRQAVIERSLRYTSEREHMGARLPASTRPADLAAHALFFAVADAAKIMIPLAELHGRGSLPEHGTLRVLDVGAGPGAMTLGTLDFLRRIGCRSAVEVHAVDRDREALDILRLAVADVAARWDMDIEVTTASADITATTPAGAAAYDLVLVGSVLNELDPEKRWDVLSGLIDAVHEAGALIVIEPALRETARDLHALRDRILEQGRAYVFAPCVRQGSPCPMLADERDWCHEDRPVVLPERTAQLATATGLRIHGLKFSYLVLRHAAARQVAVQPGAGSAARVVSQLRNSKGKRECFVCTDAGRHLVRLLRRNRSTANRDFERVRRGDVLVMGRVSGDLERDEQVVLMRPAETEPDHRQES